MCPSTFNILWPLLRCLLWTHWNPGKPTSLGSGACTSGDSSSWGGHLEDEQSMSFLHLKFFSLVATWEHQCVEYIIHLCPAPWASSWCPQQQQPLWISAASLLLEWSGYTPTYWPLTQRYHSITTYIVLLSHNLLLKRNVHLMEHSWRFI